MNESRPSAGEVYAGEGSVRGPPEAVGHQGDIVDPYHNHPRRVDRHGIKDERIWDLENGGGVARLEQTVYSAARYGPPHPAISPASFGQRKGTTGEAGDIEFGKSAVPVPHKTVRALWGLIIPGDFSRCINALRGCTATRCVKIGNLTVRIPEEAMIVRGLNNTTALSAYFRYLGSPQFATNRRLAPGSCAICPRLPGTLASAKFGGGLISLVGIAVRWTLYAPPPPAISVVQLIETCVVWLKDATANNDNVACSIKKKGSAWRVTPDESSTEGVVKSQYT